MLADNGVMKSNATTTEEPAMNATTTPQNVTLSAIGAVHTVASAIAGHGGDIVLHRGELAAAMTANRDYTELRLQALDGSWGSCSVTIERPGVRYGGPSDASINFSSASSKMADPIEFAFASAALIDFAARVAEQLNEWNV